jgi:putative cardiolipin synthase
MATDCACAPRRGCARTKQPGKLRGRTASLIVAALSAPILAVAALSGCASLPTDYEKSESFAIRDSSQTALGKLLTPITEQHTDKSGFFPLASGSDALVARAELIEAAERTLDVQYYIWHADLSGRLLVELLLRAADRGVRVRLLLDDLDTAGKDFALAAIDAHPNVEIRLYNPFANRSSRGFDFVTDLRRVNRRMHNKSLTVDNQATIVGGRNIGNEYFGADSATQFSDLDVLAVGPVVAEVSGAFDTYWNSEWVVPLSAFDADDPVTADELETARAGLQDYLAAQRSSPYATAVRDSERIQHAEISELDYSWGRAMLLYDAPSKAQGTEVAEATHIGPSLVKVFDEAQSELIVVSPYFVPGKKLVDYFGQLVDRGVRVRILTNSLAANDVGVVHAGYMRYRVGLLENGVELYEFKPVRGVDDQGAKKSWTGSSKASLHAKTFSVDRKYLFVGSFNLDPRSVVHNTEMGVLFESPELAAALGDSVDNRLLQRAYRLELTSMSGNGQSSTPALQWVTEENGEQVRYGKEPETSFFQRFGTGFLSIFVIESLL